MDTPLDAIRDLDPDACRRARLARDPRFDGEFFVAVSSTGIYCRPVCPARLPAERNVRYFRHAAQAGEAGYRPCLRCRPETAPGSPAWRGSASSVQRALRLIGEGALDGDGSVEALAARLGIGSRYLNKLFRRELGLAPSDVARHQRLLLARQLIVESALPLTDVAFAAGFGSVRRFNAAIRDAYATAPGDMRRRRAPRGTRTAPIRLELRYRPPYDWHGVLAFLARHALPGLEQIIDGRYERQLSVDGQRGRLVVSHLPRRHTLLLELELAGVTTLAPLVARLRRMFDLDAHPAAVAAVFAEDRILAPLLARHPGVRCPGHYSAFEAAVRAIVGQQISTAAARRICAGFVAATGARDFPGPAALLALDDGLFPMPGRRRETLRELCRRCIAEGDRALQPEALESLRGVGPWTVAMTALRGWGAPDAFPATDLGIVQAWERLRAADEALAERANSWAPFRGYAATLLWKSL
jgi:AraC family transcriptional regulator of adaptative response / DNA-3-methyladenine glycosylase II